MHILISDAPQGAFEGSIAESFNQRSGGTLRIISPQESIRNCIGCFACWVKTPGECVIKDGLNTGALFGTSSELVIVSECVYGGFSPFIKNVLDRSIPYISPYFRMLNGEMHHKARYANSLRFSVCFYGADITETEKELAKRLVAANAVNLFMSVQTVLFASNPTEAFSAVLQTQSGVEVSK